MEMVGLFSANCHLQECTLGYGWGNKCWLKSGEIIQQTIASSGMELKGAKMPVALNESYLDFKDI